MKHEITFADLNKMLFVITFFTILSLAYHFMGAMGLEKAPLFKVGNDRKSLRTTAVVEDGES